MYIFNENKNQALETMRGSEHHSSKSGLGGYGAKISGESDASAWCT